MNAQKHNCVLLTAKYSLGVLDLQRQLVVSRYESGEIGPFNIDNTDTCSTGVSDFTFGFCCFGRGILRPIIFSFLVLLYGASVIWGGEASRPNVIFILADDLGYGDVGYQGCSDIPTPHIDSIAQEGVAFSAGYSAAPVCGPSRAGLLTGRYQNRFGYQDNIGPYGRDENVELGTPLEVKTIADRFRGAGYITGMIGKWHDGDEEKYWPNNRGFDYFFGFNNGAANYFVGRENATTDKWGAIHRNGTRATGVGEYLTDVFGDESVRFIEKNRDKPFFLYLSFNAVHGPLQAPKRYLDKFPKLEGKRKILAAMNAAMDINVGKVLKALKNTDMDRRTLVVFTSDNGGKPKGNFSYNGPLHGEKGQTFDGGIRVPVAIRWPGQLKAGRTLDDPMHALDLMPTALAAAGIPVEPEWKLEGVNLLPIMKADVEALPKRFLHWRLNTNWAVRDREWKLVSMNGRSRLFRIGTDIGESKDLIKQHPEIAQRLQREMDAWDAANEPARWGWNKKTCKHFVGYRQFVTEDDLIRAQKRKR